MRDLIRVEMVTVNSSGILQSLNTNAQTTSGGGAVPFEALLLQATGNQAGGSPNVINSCSDGVDAVIVVGTGATDGFAGILSIARGTVFNGATWDRLRSAAVGDAAASTGLPAQVGFLWNGASFDRQREVIGDGQAAAGILVNQPTVWNGATYDRTYSGSAANLGATSSKGAVLSTPPGNWTLISAPAANNVATATRAATAGVRHVLTTLTFSCEDTAGAIVTKCVVRDGATGVGTILWQAILGTGANGGFPIPVSGLNIVGTAGNAMTVEFTSTSATTTESVSATGYDAT